MMIETTAQTETDLTAADLAEIEARAAQTAINADKIHQAWAAGHKPGEWAMFSALREDAGLSRPEFDAAIWHLFATDNHFYMIPESNQKTLRDADREAAMWCGNQWKHLAGWNA